MKIRLLAAALIVLILGACQTASEVIRSGPDTYIISSAACPACGGSAKAVLLALRKASAFCQAQGKEMLRKDMRKENLNYVGAGGSTLEFRCLDKDHPEFVRADGKRDSDIVIEHRQPN
jgi:hypothetical protein